VKGANGMLVVETLGDDDEVPEISVEEVHEHGGEVVVIARPAERPGERLAWQATVSGGAIVAGPSPADPESAVSDAGLAATTGRAIALVRRHYAAYAARDADALLATLDPDVDIRVHDERAGGAELFHAHEGADSFFHGIWSLITDIAVEILSLDASPGRVEASVRLSGTVRATGEAGSVPAVHFFTLADDLITRIETYRPDWRAAVEG
jgi:ketosteroid isomerase-like protein